MMARGTTWMVCGTYFSGAEYLGELITLSGARPATSTSAANVARSSTAVVGDVIRTRTPVPSSIASSACSRSYEPETPGDWIEPIGASASVTWTPLTRSKAATTSLSGPAAMSYRWTVDDGLS